MVLMKERIDNAQRDGWVQPDLDPEELAAMLHSLVLAATIQLLQYPSSRDTNSGSSTPTWTA